MFEPNKESFAGPNGQLPLLSYVSYSSLQMQILLKGKLEGYCSFVTLQLIKPLAITIDTLRLCQISQITLIQGTTIYGKIQIMSRNTDGEDIFVNQKKNIKINRSILYHDSLLYVHLIDNVLHQPIKLHGWMGCIDLHCTVTYTLAFCACPGLIVYACIQFCENDPFLSKRHIEQ